MSTLGEPMLSCFALISLDHLYYVCAPPTFPCFHFQFLIPAFLLQRTTLGLRKFLDAQAQRFGTAWMATSLWAAISQYLWGAGHEKPASLP